MITSARVCVASAFVILALTCAGSPALARMACGDLLMPALHLKQVARGVSAHHSGLDLTAPYGSPVRAAAAGEVVFAGHWFGYGHMVDLRHADGSVTRYGHLSAYAPDLSVGRLVAAGGLLGQIGTSGRASGPHLHFEIRVRGLPVDPKPMLALAACPAGAEPIEQAMAPEPRRSPRPH